MEIYITKPCSISAALNIGIEVIRLFPHPIGIPAAPFFLRKVNAASVPMVAVKVNIPVCIVGHGVGIRHHFLIKPQILPLGHIQFHPF